MRVCGYVGGGSACEEQAAGAAEIWSGRLSHTDPGRDKFATRMIHVRRLLVLAVAALLVARNAEAEQRIQLLSKTKSSVGAADWLEGGSCGDASSAQGCRRQVVLARAVALGQPFESDACGVVDRSVGDGNTMEDIAQGATLGVLHACESGGEVLPQVGALSRLFFCLRVGLLLSRLSLRTRAVLCSVF